MHLQTLSPALFALAVLLVLFLPFSGSRVSGQSSPNSTYWTTADIGSPLIPGVSASLPCSLPACPLWSVTSGGAGVTGSADQFTFVSQRLAGDGVVTVRVASLTLSTGEAGVTIRESLSSGSRHVSLFSGGAIRFKRRTTAGGSTTTTTRTKPSGAIWLRLERKGTTITASTSTDGTQWTIVGTQTVSLPSNVYVGIAVSSGAAGSATATVSNPLSQPTSTLPAGWASADVGQAALPGTASFSNGAFIASSAGRGLSGSADAFRLVYVRITGDATLVARVAATQGPTGRVAGITLRESLAAGAAHYSLTSKNGTGLVIAQRAAPLASTSSVTIAARVPPVWLKLVRRGNVMTASHSSDGVSWTAAPGATTSLASSLYAGLLVAGGSSLTNGAAAFDNTSLTATAANRKPIVSVTSPAANAAVVSGASVSITASASDPDDRVARVDFLINGTPIGSDTTSPYNASWTAGVAGTYSVTARAFDFDGGVTTSAPVSISAIGSSSSTSSPTPTPTPTPDGPWRLEFDPSLDHAKVTSYVLEIRRPSSSVVLVSKNLGKPAVNSSGTCVADVNLLVSALAVGEYQAVVRAVAASGSTSSYPITFVR